MEFQPPDIDDRFHCDDGGIFTEGGNFVKLCPGCQNCAEPPVLGAGGGVAPMPTRYLRLKWECAFQWKRLRVCLLCWWYLRHWPWGDLSTAEWKFQLAGETARSAFLEGWCRMDDLGDKS